MDVWKNTAGVFLTCTFVWITKNPLLWHLSAGMCGCVGVFVLIFGSQLQKIQKITCCYSDALLCCCWTKSLSIFTPFLLSEVERMSQLKVQQRNSLRRLLRTVSWSDCWAVSLWQTWKTDELSNQLSRVFLLFWQLVQRIQLFPLSR